jgi:hypothetical protein
MGNFSDKSCRENQNTRFIFSIFFLNHDLYETVWKNTVQPDRPQMAVRPLRISRRVPKATDTQSLHMQYLLLKQRLNGRASMLRYPYIACLVYL